MGFLFRSAAALVLAACWSSPDAMIALLRKEVVEPVRANCAPGSLLCAEEPLTQLASALSEERKALAPEQLASEDGDIAEYAARAIATTLGRH